MRIRSHGGHCCGVKHIFGFGHPDSFLSKREEKGFIQDDIDSCVKPVDDFFSGPAPEETEKNRLVRYIKWLRSTRPGHLVEVCLVHKSQYSWMVKTPLWETILFEQGFKLVTEFKNSNSKNTVRVYHLVLTTEKE